MRISLFLPAFALVPLLAACADRSWAGTNTKLVATMKPVAAALGTPNLPTCAAGADAKYLLLAETDVLALAAGDDRFVEKNQAGLSRACRGVAARDVDETMNRFNPEGHRVDAAKKLFAAKGFAVVTTETRTAPSARGFGKTAGRIVLVSQTGAAECQIPWEAINSETTTVAVDAFTAKTGGSAPLDARQKAWESDLEGNSCKAILKSAKEAISARR